MTLPIHLLELPIEFTKPLKDLEIMENQPLTLTCQVNKPDLVATWQKDGKNIDASDRVQIVRDGVTHTLKIDKAVLEDDSVYKCTIKDRKTSARVTVKGE